MAEEVVREATIEREDKSRVLRALTGKAHVGAVGSWAAAREHDVAALQAAIIPPEGHAAERAAKAMVGRMGADLALAGRASIPRGLAGEQGRGALAAAAQTITGIERAGGIPSAFDSYVVGLQAVHLTEKARERMVGSIPLGMAAKASVGSFAAVETARAHLNDSAARQIALLPNGHIAGIGRTFQGSRIRPLGVTDAIEVVSPRRLRLVTHNPPTPMDAYEDTTRALDELIEWLEQDPHNEPSSAGTRFVSRRMPGEYQSELVKRSARVVLLMNHLIEDGLQVPREYAWRRFRETIENGCHFDVDYGYDEKEQKEILRIVRTARVNLESVYLRSSKPRPKTRTPITEVILPEVQPVAETRQAERPNVGYGWPLKIVFASVVTGAWVWGFPRLVALVLPTIEHNTTYALTWITTSLTVFFGAIALANIVRKP